MLQPNFTFVDPNNYPVSQPTPRGWGGSGSLFGNYWVGDWLWDAFTGGLRNQPRTSTTPRPVIPSLLPLGYPTGPAPRTEAEASSLRQQWTGNAVAPPVLFPPINLPPRDTSQRPFTGKLRPIPPPGTNANAQYYDAAALRAAAPYANAQPGWYTPSEINRFGTVLGPDQIRGLAPLIDAERARLTGPTGAPKPTWEAWMASQSPARQSWIGDGQGVLEQRLRGEYAAIPGQTPGLGNLAANRQLATMFPGYGTPPARPASTPPAPVPPGMEWAFGRNTSSVGGAWGYRPIPNYRPPVTSYRGGQLR